MTRWYVWHDSFIHVAWHIHTWLIHTVDIFHTCEMTHWTVWHDSVMYLIWLIELYDMTQWCIWYDSHRRLNGVMKSTFYVAVYFFCGMTHSHVWRDLFLCVTWRIHMCDMTYSHVWHDTHRRFNGEMKATPCRSMPLLCTHTYRWVRAAGVWGTSDWYVWHNSLIWGTWLIGMCDMSHWYVWHDSFICVTWLIDMCDMTQWYVWHDS